MVNVIKDIVNKLDGYSSDNQGIADTSFAPAEVNGGLISRMRRLKGFRKKST